MFQGTARRLIQYVGGTKLSDLPKTWQTPVDKVLSEEEIAVCLDIHIMISRWFVY